MGSRSIYAEQSRKAVVGVSFEQRPEGNEGLDQLDSGVRMLWVEVLARTQACRSVPGSGEVSEQVQL